MKDKYDFLLMFSTPQNHRCKKLLVQVSQPWTVREKKKRASHIVKATIM